LKTERINILFIDEGNTRSPGREKENVMVASVDLEIQLCVSELNSKIHLNNATANTVSQKLFLGKDGWKLPLGTSFRLEQNGIMEIRTGGLEEGNGERKNCEEIGWTICTVR